MTDPVFEQWARKLLALGIVGMMMASLVAISLERAEDKQHFVAATASQSDGSLGLLAPGNATDSGTDAMGALDSSAGGATTGAATPTGGGSSGTKTSTAGAGGATSGGGATSSGGGATSSGGGAMVRPSSGTDCPDYNPAQGVYCDHFLIGGTTVLSGPLAVYGDQGLKGGKAWIAYYNTQIAPREGLRQAKLVWYDDNLDPNKTLQYVERLNEVDKVLYLGGITSPEAASEYLKNAPCASRAGQDDCPMGPNRGFPLIGDIGLSPKSYTNPMIYATAPSPELQSFTRTRTMAEATSAKSIGVVYGVLPGVDTASIQKSW